MACTKYIRLKCTFYVYKGRKGDGGFEISDVPGRGGVVCFYLTLILLRLFQQHNVTGQSQESEGFL